MPTSYIRKILNAQIYDLVRETPVQNMPFLSKSLQNRVLVKREDLQPVFSFKLRGAYARMLQLTPAERQRGVIAASAGNHAQGVAMSAAHLGVRATIVMPVTTQEIKIQSVRERGAEVVLFGDNFDVACAHAYELAAANGYVFVHPYDDPHVIAGQGTIGMELMRQLAEPVHAVFVPVRGGALIAGVAMYLKYVRPDIRVIGVESDTSACLAAARQAGRRVTLPGVGIFADGVAVATIGREPFRIAKRFVDDVVTVNNDEICAAIKDLFDDTRSIAEPAGALGLAGLKKYAAQHRLRGETLVTIESGANVNFGRLRYISQRAEFGGGREILLGVTISARPGSLREFCGRLKGYGITSLHYRYFQAAESQILIGLEVRSSGEQRGKIVATLRRQGYLVEDYSGNELAKEHVCFMVGGQASGLKNEYLYRFEFPERPGALTRFLSVMPETWNLSLFNYRNQGGAYGTVCIGLQIPPKERPRIKGFLRQLNYPWVEETGNPAYSQFLR